MSFKSLHPVTGSRKVGVLSIVAIIFLVIWIFADWGSSHGNNNNDQTGDDYYPGDYDQGYQDGYEDYYNDDYDRYDL
jgi:hypothetical protein